MAFKQHKDKINELRRLALDSLITEIKSIEKTLGRNGYNIAGEGEYIGGDYLIAATTSFQGVVDSGALVLQAELTNLYALAELFNLVMQKIAEFNLSPPSSRTSDAGSVLLKRLHATRNPLSRLRTFLASPLTIRSIFFFRQRSTQMVACQYL